MGEIEPGGHRPLPGLFGRSFLLTSLAAFGPLALGAEDTEVSALHRAVTFYASFDAAVEGDRGGGNLAPRTRFDSETAKGKHVFEAGIDAGVFRVAKGKGVHGGALEVTDVLPRRGRIFFPAAGNLGYDPTGWGGAVSFWLNTDPDKLLKTSFCDPVQITEKGAGNGGLWVDFPDVEPRDLRLGAFRALGPGERKIPESDPLAPIVRVRKIGFRKGEWHHIVFTWSRFDTGKSNAEAGLYIDGKRIGGLRDRDIAVRWDLKRTGIYVAVNFIGLLDELAVFGRPLRPGEVALLHRQPGLLAPLKKKAPGAAARSEATGPRRRSSGSGRGRRRASSERADTRLTANETARGTWSEASWSSVVRRSRVARRTPTRYDSDDGELRVDDVLLFEPGP